ncbi:response regulator [Nitrogeniibacter aestuarii]|uniref:response regulator n=1 Tax=Nitrogeniibacter aestuarii TaxID=2815343 RepID=UPI001D12DE17|nr:response regulator [Nitrogeniibacter aestuarii]
MLMDEVADAAEITGTVLVVDDVATTRALHRGLLARQFDVLTASSGAEALETCRRHRPDLVLLDISMPGMDGVEACRRLREWTDVPVIFATSYETLEEQMRAYDAGGSDIIVKPVKQQILMRKVALAIRQHQSAKALKAEKQTLHEMAMQFLSSVGQKGALLNFMRASVGCRSHEQLANKLFEAVSELGLECSVMLRHTEGTTYASAGGEATPIERRILEQTASLGRLFQFKRRLAVNYDHVSIVVANMPDEEEHAEEAGRIRDNMAILAEITEALCENVDMRRESVQRTEQLQVAWGGTVAAVESLRTNYLKMLGDTRILLHELVSKVERGFHWLGASEPREIEISNELNDSIQAILGLLAEGGDFDQRFEQVLDALKQASPADDVELF